MVQPVPSSSSFAVPQGEDEGGAETGCSAGGSGSQVKSAPHRFRDFLIATSMLFAAGPAHAQAVRGARSAPVAARIQPRDTTYLTTSQLGAANGVAALDGNTHVVSGEIPYGATTGTVADGGLLASTTATANAALPLKATQNAPETGVVDFEGAGRMVYHGNNTFQWDGTGDQTWLGEGGSYIYGFSNGAHPFANFTYAEGLKDATEADTHYVADYINDGARGARNVSLSDLEIQGRLGDASTLIPTVSHVLNQGSMPTLAADGWPVGPFTTGGGTQGIWDISGDTPSRPISGLAGVYGMEQDTAFSPSELVSERIGVDVVDQGALASTPYVGVYHHGIALDTAVDVQGQSWQTAYSIGSTTNGYSGNAESTLFKVYQREYGGSNGAPFVARNGIDLRGMTFGGSAWASNGAAIGPAGTVSAKTLETGTGVQAYAAGVSGASIVEGGLYNGFPTFTVDAPQLGGTTATVTTSAMSLFSLTGFNATGTGYKMNDVLTAGTGLKADQANDGNMVQDVGVTGTTFQFTVTAVDKFGGITAGKFSNLGSITDVPPDHLLTLVGGSGSGAVAFIYWNMNTTDSNGNALTPSSYTLVPGGWVPGATGSGFKPGDTIKTTTDTGTAGSLEIASVTPNGGILMQGLSLASGGNVTAIGSESPRTFATSGSGVGANANFGYSVAALATTPGSGYLADVQPVVIAQQSGWWNAKVRATLTPTPTSLLLNPQGGNVTTQQSIGIKTTTPVEPLDVFGKIYAGDCNANTVDRMANAYGFTDGAISLCPSDNHFQKYAITGVNTLAWDYNPASGNLEVTDKNRGLLLESIPVNGGAYRIGTEGLTVSGPVATAVSKQTAAFTFGSTFDTAEVSNSSSTAYAATLPACTTATSGRSYQIVKIDSNTDPITLAASGSDTVSGAGTISITAQWTAISVKCDGAGLWLRGLR